MRIVHLILATWTPALSKHSRSGAFNRLFFSDGSWPARAHAERQSGTWHESHADERSLARRFRVSSARRA